MEFESTLRVSSSRSEGPPGVVEGQTLQPLIGMTALPSERIRVAVATFKAGMHEDLHWHAIEVFYYVIAGSAIVRDYHGKEYNVGAGTAIYAPPGIAGSHEWQVGPNGLQLLSIRATRDGHTSHAVHRRPRNPALLHRARRAREDGWCKLRLTLLRKA